MIGAELRRVPRRSQRVHRPRSRVVVKGRFIGKNKSGVELDTGFEHVFDMRDGKVVRFENKPDDAEAWIAGAGPANRATGVGTAAQEPNNPV